MKLPDATELRYRTPFTDPVPVWVVDGPNQVSAAWMVPAGVRTQFEEPHPDVPEIIRLVPTTVWYSIQRNARVPVACYTDGTAERNIASVAQFAARDVVALGLPVYDNCAEASQCAAELATGARESNMSDNDDLTSRLQRLAQEGCGLRYDSSEARQILDAEDWPDHWPVIDSAGMLTGEVVTSGEEGWYNVEDLAAIRADTLTPAVIAFSGGMTRIREDGYVSIPESDQDGAMGA